jgi:hypothetical protein
MDETREMDERVAYAQQEMPRRREWVPIVEMAVALLGALIYGVNQHQRADGWRRASNARGRQLSAARAAARSAEAEADMARGETHDLQEKIRKSVGSPGCAHVRDLE